MYSYQQVTVRIENNEGGYKSYNYVAFIVFVGEGVCGPVTFLATSPAQFLSYFECIRTDISR